MASQIEGEIILELYLQLAYDGFKASLLITEAYPNHSGTYSVSAKNRAGEATSTCQVAVRARIAETS